MVGIGTAFYHKNSGNWLIPVVVGEFDKYTLTVHKCQLNPSGFLKGIASHELRMNRHELESGFYVRAVPPWRLEPPLCIGYYYVSSGDQYYKITGFAPAEGEIKFETYLRSGSRLSESGSMQIHEFCHMVDSLQLQYCEDEELPWYNYDSEGLDDPESEEVIIDARDIIIDDEGKFGPKDCILKDKVRVIVPVELGGPGID